MLLLPIVPIDIVIDAGRGLEMTSLLEGTLDLDVVAGRGLEGTSSGRIRSMLLLLIVPIDAVDCSDRCCCCCCGCCCC